MRASAWLRSTRAFQRRAFNTNVDTLKGPRLADYLQYNIAAIFVELGELAQEIGWKPWDTRRGWVNRARVVDEAADVLMFLGNILAAAGVTDHEIAAAIERKRADVYKRQLSGKYTSSKKETKA